MARIEKTCHFFAREILDIGTKARKPAPGDFFIDYEIDLTLS